MYSAPTAHAMAWVSSKVVIPLIQCSRSLVDTKYVFNHYNITSILQTSNMGSENAGVEIPALSTTDGEEWTKPQLEPWADLTTAAPQSYATTASCMTVPDTGLVSHLPSHKVLPAPESVDSPHNSLCHKCINVLLLHLLASLVPRPLPRKGPWNEVNL